MSLELRGKLQCPFCQKEGLKSRVDLKRDRHHYDAENVEFWDENGFEHFHAYRTDWYNGWCSNGHKFILSDTDNQPIGCGCGKLPGRDNGVKFWKKSGFFSGRKYTELVI